MQVDLFLVLRNKKIKPIKHILFHITVYTQVTILVQNVCTIVWSKVCNKHQPKKKKININISRFIFTFIIFFWGGKFIAYFRIKIYIFFFYLTIFLNTHMWLFILSNVVNSQNFKNKNYAT